MSILSIVKIQAEIFLMIFLGFVLKKIKLLTKGGERCIGDLVLYVFLPCNIVLSYVGRDISIFRQLVWVLVISVLHQFVTLFLSRIMWKGYKREQRAVLQYSIQFSNCGFMGMPVAQSFFGADGLLYSSVYTFPINFFMYTVGMSPFAQGEKHDFKYILKKVLLHPCLCAVYVGLALMIFSVSLPSLVTETLQTLSGALSPLSMLLVGGLLGESDFSHIVSKDVLVVTAVRMIAVPMGMILFCKALGLPFLTGSVCAMLSGMPIGTMAAIFALKYDCDEHLASNCIIFSTFISVITLPVVYWVSTFL